jgi:chemotaxis protein histidine kinase CheA
VHPMDTAVMPSARPAVDSARRESRGRRVENRIAAATESAHANDDIGGACSALLMLAASLAPVLHMQPEQALQELRAGTTAVTDAVTGNAREGADGAAAAERFMARVSADAPQLAAALAADGETAVAAVLSVVGYGLGSTHTAVSLAATAALTDLAHAMRTAGGAGLARTAADWLLSDARNPLNALVRCVNASHSEQQQHASVVLGALVAFCPTALHSLLCESLRVATVRSRSDDDNDDDGSIGGDGDANALAAYLTTLERLTAAAAAHAAHREKWVEQGLVLSLMDVALSVQRNDGDAAVAAALELLATVWLEFAKQVEATAAGDYCRAALERLKSHGRSARGSPTLQLGAVRCSFRLLRGLADSGSAYAPIVYKSLIFTLVESAHDSPVRDALMRQMAGALSKHRNLPVAVLLDPLLRQVEMRGLTGAEVGLLAEVAHHPALSCHHQAATLQALLGLALAGNAAAGKVVPVVAALVKRLGVEAHGDEGQSEAWASALEMLVALAGEPWEAEAETEAGATARSAAADVLCGVAVMPLREADRVTLRRAALATKASWASRHDGGEEPALERALRALGPPPRTAEMDSVVIPLNTVELTPQSSVADSDEDPQEELEAAAREDGAGPADRAEEAGAEATAPSAAGQTEEESCEPAAAFPSSGGEAGSEEAATASQEKGVSKRKERAVEMSLDKPRGLKGMDAKPKPTKETETAKLKAKVEARAAKAETKAKAEAEVKAKAKAEADAEAKAKVRAKAEKAARVERAADSTDAEARRRNAELRRKRDAEIEAAQRRVREAREAAAAEAAAEKLKQQRLTEKLRRKRDALLRGDSGVSPSSAKPWRVAPKELPGELEELVIDGLNRRLAEDPNAVLPPGFMRVRPTTVTVERDELSGADAALDKLVDDVCVEAEGSAGAGTVGKAERAERLRLNKLMEADPTAALPAGWVKVHTKNSDAIPRAPPGQQWVAKRVSVEPAPVTGKGERRSGGGGGGGADDTATTTAAAGLALKPRSGRLTHAKDRKRVASPGLAVNRSSGPLKDKLAASRRAAAAAAKATAAKAAKMVTALPRPSAFAARELSLCRPPTTSSIPAATAEPAALT